MEINQLSDVSATDSFPVSSTATGPEGTSRWYTAVFIVINAGMGAGLLNFPASYNKAGGVLISTIVHIILVIFVVISLLMLSYCSDLNKSSTYQDVVEFTCGKIGKLLCATLVAVYCYGTCVTFFIIIGDQLDQVLSFAYGPDFCDHWYMDRKFTITMSSCIFILPLCFPKQIDFLKYASAAGVIASLYVVGLIVVEFYTCDDSDHSHVRTQPQHWTDIFEVIPVICFSYQCHISAVPVYACLTPRRLPEFSKSIVAAIVTLFVAYAVAATFGYLTFGSVTASDILVNYSGSDSAATAARVMVALKTYTTYPILLFCGRLALDDIWLALLMGTTNEARRRVMQTMVWFSTSLVLAIFIPNIGQVIDVLGSLAAVFIFVFPGVCLIRRVELRDPEWVRRKYRVLLVTGVMFVVLGTFLFVVVVIQSTSATTTSGTTSQPICS